MRTFVFIDASNLFYGGEKSLGWKINYQTNETVGLKELEKHLQNLIQSQGGRLNEAELLLIGRHLQRVRFYKHLDSFGYKLFLKPVKLYEQEDGSTKRKANCDVDMAFYLMKEVDNFDRAIVLSGDGDFLPVLKYLRAIGKEIVILGRGARTAKEMRKFAGSNFRDFEYLKNQIKMS